MREIKSVTDYDYEVMEEIRNRFAANGEVSESDLLFVRRSTSTLEWQRLERRRMRAKYGDLIEELQSKPVDTILLARSLAALLDVLTT